ncbi:MAG: hypothetical protein JXA73_03330 [Acidobacteria bacterium]|nr:hypothetical protein [Acidobacteriota bacterium]
MATNAESKSDGIGNGRLGIGFWWLLLPIPIMLAIVFILPQLGTYGEGILPELLGTHLLNSEDYMKFALEARVWGGAILALSCLIGILLWYAQLRGWHLRLNELRAERAKGYRSFVSKRMFLAGLFAVLVGAGISLFQSSLRGMPVVSWFYLLGACALLSIIQYFFTMLGIKSTRRFFMGR